MQRTAFFCLSLLALTAIAHLRPPEYDEAYSIFLTAGDARPHWPAGIFTAASVQAVFTGPSHLHQIATDLRRGDVHPPLYFWLLKIWRGVAGPGWFTARLLSVGIALGSLALLARIARNQNIPVLPSLGITLLSYGFAYTSTVARGFALAEFLTLLGFVLALPAVMPAKAGIHAFSQPAKSRAVLAGLAFGAASFTNYLAIFPGLALLAWHVPRQPAKTVITAAGLALFLPFDAFFFLAQRNTRIGQFAAFSPPHALALLAKDFGATLFGGLPLYAGAAGPLVSVLLLSLFLVCVITVIQTRHASAPLFTLCAAATPAGLFALGLIFNNTPIEIRYLAFSIPFVALLFAAALPRALRATLLTVQAAAIVGLALAPATMQPQGRAAAQAAAFHALVLVPYGNDGVGIPGPFIAASPPDARILLLHPGAPPQIATQPAAILALIAVDASSRATIAATQAWFAANLCWRPQTRTSLTILFVNTCLDEHAQHHQ